MNTVAQAIRHFDRFRSTKPPGGFTLVELLVVVTVILALLAILFPSLNRAIATTEVAICASNLRQIGVGTISYATDNDKMWPTCQDWETDLRDWGAWHRPIGANNRIAPSTEGKGGLIYPYMRNADAYVCPTFATHAAPIVPAGERVVWSYAMHESFKWAGDWQGLTIRRTSDPYILPGSQVMITEESPFVPTKVANYQLNNSCWGVSRDANPAAMIDSVATFHLSNDPTLMTGNGNALFVDGHAELCAMNQSVDPKVLAFPIDFPAHLWRN